MTLLGQEKWRRLTLFRVQTPNGFERFRVMSLPPAGWYSSPNTPPNQRRWWTGSQWTEHLKDVHQGTSHTSSGTEPAIPDVGASAPLKAALAPLQRNDFSTSVPLKGPTSPVPLKTPSVSASGNTAAKAGFWLGVASAFLFTVPLLGFLLCLAAAIVSAVGLDRHKQDAPKSDKVYAIIGLVLGFVYTLMVLIHIVTGRM